MTLSEDKLLKELQRMGEYLKKIDHSTQAAHTALAQNAVQTEVLTQILTQLGVIACSLEQISKQTCESLNEAHYQTDLQKSIREYLNLIVDLYKTAHAAAAVEVDRLRELNKRIEECCPVEGPKPICEHIPCTPTPPPVHGSAESSKASANANIVSGAKFPPIEIKGEVGGNEDRVPIVPVGPMRGSYAPTVQGCSPNEMKLDSAGLPPAGGAGNPVVFGQDSPLGVAVTATPPDMSGAMNGDVVLISGNVFAALSTDGGKHFTSLNPTTIFPSGPTRDSAGNLLDNGLCCDQVIQYAPQIDRFIWLMQFCGTGGATPGGSCLQGINKLRVASASTADVVSSGGTAWTYWDLTSGLFNLGNTTMDYPDMSIGSNSLYVSADAVGTGLLILRISLAEIQQGGTITINFTNPSDSSTAYGGHICQDTTDAVFWAGHVNTSRMRIFNWQENSGQYSWRDIDINSWPNSDYSSSCPDGTDWLNFMSGFPGSAVIGTARRFGGGFFPGPPSEVWFAWTAARGGGFPHPHVQVVQIDTSNWTVTNQWQIWNPNHAFAYPCLATNGNQEIGISLGWGGNLYFASHAVGILGDFVVWYSEQSNAAINRWGDFVTARQATPRNNLYCGVGYSVLKNTPPATGIRFNPRYILFGRESDVNPPPIK